MNWEMKGKYSAYSDQGFRLAQLTPIRAPFKGVRRGYLRIYRDQIGYIGFGVSKRFSERIGPRDRRSVGSGGSPIQGLGQACLQTQKKVCLRCCGKHATKYATCIS